jgi:hypothetical protein
VGLEWSPLNLVNTIEELLEIKSSDSGLEYRDYGRKESAALTTQHPLSAKVGTKLRRQAAVTRYSSLADLATEFVFFVNNTCFELTWSFSGISYVVGCFIDSFIIEISTN